MFYEKWSNHVDIVWVSYTYSYIIVQSCYNVRIQVGACARTFAVSKIRINKGDAAKNFI